jgi:hypothetical protein
MQPSALLRGVVLLAGLAGVGLPSACGGDSDSNADGGPDADPDGGDPNSLDCEARSGTRIRQVYREHSDGSQEFLRLFDKELGETCSYGLAADGSLRCIPVADGSPFAAGTVMYDMPGCAAADRIAQLDAPIGDPAPTHMQQIVPAGTSDGCGAVTFNYELGAALVVTPGTTTLYRLDGDTCTTVTAGSNPYYDIASVVQPDELVAGTESWVGQGRIQQRRLDGDDGSRWCDVDSFRDIELETACMLQYGEDNSIQCLPAQLPIGSYFSEAACGAPSALALMVVPGECDSGARYAFETALPACNYRRRVRAIGLEYGDPYFEMDGTCMQVTPANGDTAYLVGPAISGTSFATFTRTFITSGGSRLERGDLDNGLGLRFFRRQWRDTMLDMLCAFTVLADETIACIPTSSQEVPVATVTSLFSDTGCTTPVQVGQLDLTCFAGAEPTHALDGTRVYPVTGPAPATYRMEGACVQVTDMAVFALGAEITPDMFVTGVEMTE